ncbi:MAG: hypothetical protein IPK72_23630 [Candidatus Eisenbacteria bacterium]|nr:hypothetical protein [Candidatus Eisenbacteria bacterium]
MRFADDTVSFPTRDGGRGSSFTASLSEAEFATQSLRILLSQLGAVTLTPIAPHFRHLDARAHDRWGNEIILVDMTNDYTVRFDRTLTDGELLLLRQDAGIEFARPVVPGRFFFTPNDEYFDEQWGLENVGQTQSVILCDGIAVPVPDFDANATEAWDDVLVPGCKIGVLDTGIYDQHEDLETSRLLKNRSAAVNDPLAAAGGLVAALLNVVQ